MVGHQWCQRNLYEVVQRFAKSNWWVVYLYTFYFKWIRNYWKQRNIIGKQFDIRFQVGCYIIYVYQKNRSPKIDLCGTPACIIFQSKFHSLRVPLWIPSLRQLLISSSRFPLPPFRFNLNNKPSCCTLSKAFDMYENTPPVCNEGLESRLRKVSCVIASNQ